MGLQTDIHVIDNMITPMENFVENFVYGHRDSDTEKNLYIPKELYLLCLFCAKVTGNSMIDAAYTLLSAAILRTFNFFEKCDNEL